MTNAKILQQTPVLFTRDLPKAVSYWDEKVGYYTLGVWGEPPDFAIAAREFAHVMLSQAHATHEIGPHWRIKNKLWNAYFCIDDACAMYLDLKELGTLIDCDLGEQPHGVLKFGIQDLDEHDIGFGQDPAPAGQN
jgi:hypothetical protein